MQYNNEETIYIVGLGHMTRTHKAVSHALTYDDLQVSLADFIQNILEGTKNLIDCVLHFEVNNYDDWTFVITGWQPITPEERESYDRIRPQLEAARDQMIESEFARDRTTLVTLADHYGIELPEIPETLATEVADVDHRLRWTVIRNPAGATIAHGNL